MIAVIDSNLYTTFQAFRNCRQFIPSSIENISIVSYFYRHNALGIFPGTKDGHKKMCSYAFDVYQDILRSMNKDMSWQWNDKLGE